MMDAAALDLQCVRVSPHTPLRFALLSMIILGSASTLPAQPLPDSDPLTGLRPDHRSMYALPFASGHRDMPAHLMPLPNRYLQTPSRK